MFARALRPPTDTKVQYVPYGRQVEFAERLGVKAIQGATKNFEGMTVEELQLLDQVQQVFGFGGVDLVAPSYTYTGWRLKLQKTRN